MSRIGFGAPLLLPLALLGAVAVCLYLWGARRRRLAEARYRGGSALSLRADSLSPVRQTCKAALIVAALTLLGVAAARPQIGTRKTLLQRQGTDILIALDVSLSMSARDAQPTRLERAKGAISALIDHLQSDRVGLVTFAGSAQLRYPLTTELETARKVLQSVTFKDGGLSAGTSIASALRQASDDFVSDQTRSKVVLLVSDGEDLGDDSAQAAQFVQSEGITLDTIGVGQTDPAPLAVVNTVTGVAAPVRDPATGGDLLTTANPAALRLLATTNRGHYYNGNSDDFAVQLADEIGRLQKTRFDSGEGDVPVERYQFVGGLALALLLLEMVLPAGRARRVHTWLPGGLSWPRFGRGARGHNDPADSVAGGD